MFLKNVRHTLAIAAGTMLTLSSGLMVSPALAGQLTRGQHRVLDFSQDAQGQTLLTGANNNYGYSIDNEWAEWGLILSADSHRNGADDILLLYDSTSAGADRDLRTGNFWYDGNHYESANQGNLLIIHEDKAGNSLDRPDDEAAGGVITFDFSSKLEQSNPFYSSVYRGVDLGTIRLMDIDQNPTLHGVRFRAFSGDQELFSKSAQELHTAGLATNIFEGVVDKDSGQLKGDNSIWDFKLGTLQRSGDNSLDLAVTKLLVEYGGSGAISGLEWHDVNEDSTTPQEIPEPASVMGLVMLGLCATGSVLKQRQGA